MNIFLCHAREDSAEVLVLYKRLRADGFHPWMDKHDLLPGQQWQPAIRKAIKAAAAFLVCISHSSVTKTGFVNREIAFALDVAAEQPEDTIFMIPVRLEDSPVPDRLQALQWCNYFEQDGYELLVKALRVRAQQVGVTLPEPQPQPQPSQPSQPSQPPQSLQPSQPSQPSPPQRIEPVSTRINLLYPITIAEWLNEDACCNTVFGNPSVYWCYVRPGTYTIGGWKKGDKAATITLPGFWISKYPITVEQYRQFIDAGGYTNQNYWTPNGWKWKQQYNRTQPYGWGETRFSEDDQPVVGLTWYEATAFAAWLDAELAGTASPGTRIRLPTEAEWEVAAAYNARGKRRTYPWGEQEPDATLADCDKDWRTGKPAPIGTYAAGAAACGAENMGGSVWECTTSDHAKYPAASGVVVDDSDGWVLWRGGSWFNPYTLSSCSARRGIDLDHARSGVRVARLFS